MMNKDVRWIQRFYNYQKAYKQLTEFIEKGQLNKFEEQGLIKSFEYTHELAWNTIKDYLEYQGKKEIYGSRDAARAAFKIGLIADGDAWMEMIEDRNNTSHTYNEEVSKKIAGNIIKRYYAAFTDLETKLHGLSVKDQQ